MKKLRLSWPLRLCVSAAVLGLLLWILPREQVWSAMRRVPLTVWAAALAALLAGHAVAAMKWRLLVSRECELSWPTALRAHFAGLSANLCLPGVAGGDVVRAAWAMRQTNRRADIGIACVADRLLDCTALLTLSALGAVLTAQLHGVIVQALITAAVMIVLAVVLALVVGRQLAKCSPESLAGRIAEALGGLVLRPAILLRSLALSLVVQGTFVGLNVYLGASAGVQAPAGAWLVAWPLAKLAASLPLSLGGLGVREAALAAFMKPFGTAAAAVIAASLIWQALLATAGLVGAMIALSPRASVATAPQEPALP